MGFGCFSLVLVVFNGFWFFLWVLVVYHGFLLVLKEEEEQA